MPLALASAGLKDESTIVQYRAYPNWSRSEEPVAAAAPAAAAAGVAAVVAAGLAAGLD